MKKFLIILIISFTTLMSFGQKKSILVVDLKESKQPIQVLIEGKNIAVEPDKNGKAILNFKITSPQYIQLLRIPKRPELLYIFPKDKLEVAIVGEAIGQLKFKGKHAELNSYLVNPKSIEIGGGFNLGEAEYIQLQKNRVDETIEKMKNHGFDKSFSQKEQKRIAAKIYTSMVGYPNIRRRTDRGYEASDLFYNFVNSELFEDENMLSLNEYTDFIEYMYRMLATKDIKKYDAFDHADKTLKYVIKNVKNEKIKAHLINFYAYDFLKRNGIQEAEPITGIFKQYVKDAEKLKIYEETWETWSKITPGRTIPDLAFLDINDTSFSLSSLQGKYIYIDVWATWCIPCIAEIPNLKKMEHKLAGKNIVFISISVDKDRVAWKKMIKEDNFTGVQWHSPSRDFSNELMIVSIPRFILLDPQGKIVDANVSRPDRDETYKLLETLDGL